MEGENRDVSGFRQLNVNLVSILLNYVSFRLSPTIFTAIVFAGCSAVRLGTIHVASDDQISKRKIVGSIKTVVTS